MVSCGRSAGIEGPARGGPHGPGLGVLGVDRGREHTRRTSSDRLALVATDPAVLSGQTVIAGTRVPVSVVLDCLAAGMSPEEVVAEYPTLTSEGVQAAAAYGGVAGP